MSEILKINDLWGGYLEGFDILRGISIDVQQGEAVGIIGLNGSGKSTLGKAIMNMLPFRKGDIFFEGEDITSLTTSHSLTVASQSCNREAEYSRTYRYGITCNYPCLDSPPIPLKCSRTLSPCCSAPKRNCNERWQTN